jgi:DNA repair protein SbcD/Mre11
MHLGTLMRIIHTADWHIGQTLAGYARDHEHRSVLAQLAALASDREADAVIVAGDVFDHQNPSGDAQRLFYDALVALRSARPSLTIVVTAGNHDAAGRLEAPDPLLQALGVRVVGSVRRRGGRLEAERHLIPLRAANGEVACEVLAVSYPTAACLPPSRAADGEPPDGQTRTLYAELREASGAGRGGVPLVVTGHLHVAGGLESEGAERRIFVGGQHAVAPDVFPDEAAYVALGHLHKAQAVGRETIRYAGSLLPLSATEIPYRHSVTLLTLDAGRVGVEHIPLARPVPFHRLPEQGDVRLSEIGDHLKALDLPADLPLEQRPFVQVWLERARLTSSFRAELDRTAEAFPVRLLDPRLARRAEEPAAGVSAPPFARLSEQLPEDLFRQAFARTHGAEPEAAHLAAFRTATAEA